MLKQITFFTALISCSLFAQDLVQNGRFDLNISDAGSVPKMWNDASGSWLQVDNDGADDTNSVSYKLGKKGVLKQTISCKAKTTYVLSASFKYEECIPSLVLSVFIVFGGAFAFDVVLKENKK